MTFLRHLAKIEAVAIAALLAVAAAFAAFFAIQTAASPGDLFSPAGAAIVFFGYTMAIGSVPVIAFGAPLYAWLLYRGKSSWAAVIAIGLVPGLVFLFAALDLGLWSMGCGTVVALATHAICRPGPNNSFKPTSLRDAA